jgi:phosphoenolpyruvate carboxylase
MTKSIDNLPKELKVLVNKCVSLLGEVIFEEGGKDLYRSVESIRKEMVEYRKSSLVNKNKILNLLYKRLNIFDKKKTTSGSSCIYFNVGVDQLL